MYKPKENKEFSCETVGELKEFLSKFDDNREIVFDGRQRGCSISEWFDDDPPHKTYPVVLLEPLDE